MSIILLSACYISLGEMEYIHAGHTLGINKPSQCGISNSFPIHRLLTRVYVYFSHSFMMHQRMVFYKRICQILVSWAPIDIKLPLFDPVFYPIKAHVYSSCAFFLDCPIAVTCGCGVVSLQGFWWLRMSQLFQCSDKNSLFNSI
jgi:hypothetical protein